MTDSATTELSVTALRRRCDPARFEFITAPEFTPPMRGLGQARALDAARFGLRMRGHGYNVFACGPLDTGKLELLREVLTSEAASRAVPDDWCYVYNFKRSHRPRALRLPPGNGNRLRSDMARLVEDLQSALPAAFGREENRTRQEEIEEQFQTRQQQALSTLHDEAKRQGILLIGTPSGFAFAPMDANGDAMQPNQFERLPPAEQARIKAAIEALEDKLQKTVRQFPIWFREMRAELKALNRQIAQYVVDHLVAELRERYREFPQVLEYFEDLATDLVEHAPAFMQTPQQQQHPLLEGVESEPVLQRYTVNVIVDNGERTAAPVVQEDLPSLGQLLGRIEHRALMGTLVTDFTLIKGGALHRANGGFLIVDARQLLLQPFAWEALKRAIRSQNIRLDAGEMQFSVLTTVTLEPQPIPLDLKVVALGERWLLSLLEAVDPDFRELFKVIADFDDSVTREAETETQFAASCAGFAREASLRPLDAAACALLVEHAARLADDAMRLTTQRHLIENLIREADFWAGDAASEIIRRDDVARAIQEQIYRKERIRVRLYEQIKRGAKLIATDGSEIGQINGLSVIQTDDFAFGQPSRITATARLGTGQVVDIEREIELGGKLHSKGVLILSRFLAARYAPGAPLSVSASLVFEQSYGMVDGDSASLAELCALLSCLAGVPIRQDYAVTGSVNQLGQVQPIGGVNEKIEGFYDICAARELTGTQGVIIPRTNIDHLMLREDVIATVEAGRFRVHAVSTVDEALSILTGIEAGTRGADSEFPAASVNGRVEARLREFADQRREFGKGAHGDKAPD